MCSVLFCHCFILNLLIGLGLVYLFNNLPHTCVDLFIRLNLLGRIDEKNVCSCCLQGVFLLSPAFSYPTFEKISLYGSFEHLLWNRYHDPVGLSSIVGHIQKPQPRNVPVLPFGKKQSDIGLAAESFPFGEGVRCL